MSNNLVINEEPVGLMGGSFEERSVWIQLLSLSLVLIGYASVAGLMWAKGVTALSAYVPVFAIGVVLMVVVIVAGHIAAAIAAKPEGRDERDRLITWRAESGASWLLSAGIACMVVSWPVVLIAHVLLLALFLSELVKLVLQIVYYRRGI